MSPFIPRRILMTADTVGGVWTYALELCRALGCHGIEVWLATMGTPPSPAQIHEVAELPSVRLFHGSFKLEWMDSPWAEVETAGEWLLRLAERFQPELVHLNGYAHGSFPWEAPTVVVGHSCVLSWWKAVKGAEAPPSWDIYRRRVESGLKAAGLVVTPSRAMLEALNLYYGPLPASLVIPNARGPLLAKTHSKEPLILSAGRLWDEAKNIAALETVAPSLSWPVYIAGEINTPSSPEREAGGNSRARNVAAPVGALGTLRRAPLSPLPTEAKRVAHFLGRLSSIHLAPWFARAAIYALPARYEPFGLSILEAAHAGCALVLGDIPSLRELWEGAAVYVPPDDHSALRRALESLISDDAFRNGLGRIARRRAAEFTPERIAKNYLAAYSSLFRGAVGQRMRPEVVCA